MANWTMGRVKGRVRALVDDPKGSWCDNAFLVPLIQDLYDDANSQIVSTQSSWDIGLVELAGIQPGTPNLADLPDLAQLTDQPLRIDWKPAGNPPSQYLLVQNYEVLPDLLPTQYMAGWEFRSQVIWLTPCSIAVDLRIRGEFGPPDLNDDTSVLTSHPRMGVAVSYGVAALAGTIRGNDKWQVAYNAKYEEVIDDIMADMVRSEQGQVRRIGRQTQRGGWGMGMVGPTAQ